MIRGFNSRQSEVWFVTGSQQLYGQQVLEQVRGHSQQIAARFSDSAHIPVKVAFKPVMTDAESITRICQDANSSDECVGLIVWMHTFSPGRMWIAGLKILAKPFLHLHTQFNRDLPWPDIDMDFMNLNQSAHGDREFGFTVSRLRINRKVVVGFWKDEDVLSEVGAWVRAAAAWQDARKLKVARFGDNMRNVAVTEGDKMEAAISLCYSVNGYGVADLVCYLNHVSDAEVDKLAALYEDQYTLADSLRRDGSDRQALLQAARIELGLRHFLENGNFHAFTDTFEDLHGLAQLPGIAVQRLMADGYGFGAEGDWKTAALVRAMKVMADGLEGGTSFMEDYTYHLKGEGLVLGAHMLEICPSIAGNKPSVEVHPLAIGGKADPVRLVFSASSGRALIASIVDFGTRFRLIANEVKVMAPEQPLPKLPVARAFWKPEPDLKVAATAWILAGGSHHTSFTQALTSEHMTDFADMAGLEFLMIDRNTTVPAFKKELRWNAAYYHLANGV